MPIHEKQSKVVANYKHNASIVKILGACIFVSLIFCAGFLVRGNTDLLTSLGFSDLSVHEEINAGETVSGNTYDSISARVAEVEGILKQDSIDSYDLDTATQLVLDSFTSSTGDSYLRYYDADAYRTYLASVSNPEAGVGILFGEVDGACYAVDVFEGSSAAAMGVLAGDFVESIDGERKSKWSMPEVVNTLARNEGESIYITWRRPDTPSSTGGETFSTTLDYRVGGETNITSEIVNGVAFIDMKQIGSDSSSVMKQTLEGVQQEGAQSIVVDLRDIPGGYLTQTVEIASLFIQSGTGVQIKTNDNVTTKSAAGESVSSLPLVVLVNNRTAGSAEVLAAALQESGRATIVGEQTQGKGSVQVMQPLSFGGALRYTAATYLTPKGRGIDATGVTPDVSVSSEESQYVMALDMAESLARR